MNLLSLMALLLFVFFLSGCEATRSGAKEVGRPVGAVMRTAGGVTEGAAEAYAGDEGDNPYSR